jgi:hypothetical protein
VFSCQGCFVCVSCLGFDPSAFITQMSFQLARVLTNAMRFPSGDQAGAKSPAGARFFVSCLSPVPSAPIV